MRKGVADTVVDGVDNRTKGYYFSPNFRSSHSLAHIFSLDTSFDESELPDEGLPSLSTRKSVSVIN